MSTELPDNWGWIKRQQERMSTPEYIEGEKIVRTFTTNLRMEKKLYELLNEHIKVCPFNPTEENPFPAGAIGGVLTYSFTDTHIGQVCKVNCACGGEFDITEYEDW